MKILLAYCKTFFIPGRASKYQNSSAGIHARTLYEVLCGYGDVDYIDTSEIEKVRGGYYDLFVGINHNFNEIRKAISCKKSVYYAVTQHPAVFIEKLISFKSRKKWHIANEYVYRMAKRMGMDRIWNIRWREEIPVFVPDLRDVDHVLVIGNQVTADTYLRNGLSRQKVDTMSYELMRGEAAAKRKLGKRVRFVFSAANLYLGKGFDIFVQLMERMHEEGYEFEITIMGAVKNPYYAGLIRKMRGRGIHVHVLGMVYDERYYTVMRKQDFYVLPSLAEGQAGTVLDAMYCGVIPVLTRETGVSYSPLGFLKPCMDMESNFNIIRKAMKMGKREMGLLSEKTAAYYNQHHLHFRERLDRLIGRYIEE